MTYPAPTLTDHDGDLRVLAWFMVEHQERAALAADDAAMTLFFFDPDEPLENHTYNPGPGYVTGYTNGDGETVRAFWMKYDERAEKEAQE